MPPHRLARISFSEIYTEIEGRWSITIDGADYSLAEVNIDLVQPDSEEPLRFAITSESDSIQLELEFFDEGKKANHRFVSRDNKTASIKSVGSTEARSFGEFLLAIQHRLNAIALVVNGLQSGSAVLVAHL